MRSSRTLRLAQPFSASAWARRPSPMMSLTGMRGFSEPYGSWKMICMLRRSLRSSVPLRSMMSSPP